MTLGDLLSGLPAHRVEATTEWAGTRVQSLAYDHRRVGPGTLFFCVRGFSRDGHDFAAEAVAAGATALVVDHPLDSGVPEVVVEDVRAAMAPLAARLAGDPTARLRAVGITGTNGKTTTAFLVRALLEAGGLRTGLLGTVTQVVGGVERAAGRTTPEAVDLQPTFAEMLAAGDDACVMEVSSHALHLGRADAIHWAAAVFTNLTQDHLDFHEDMEAYFGAKSRLFAAAGGAPKVVDVDDHYGRRLALRHPDAITVALDAEDALLRAVDVRTGPHGSTFVVGERTLRTPLAGRFNVRNALQAYAVAIALGVDADVAAGALAEAGRVPGRLEPVDAGQPFAVLVDYAHTPDSLENVLRAAREATDGGRVICVFGCGGDRDRGKRPLMGAIAARDADLAIATSDNPRSEDPEAILDEVLAGVGASRGAVERIVDRREAIERAIAEAAAGDVVLIAGKGHEHGQQLADRTIPFDDVAVAAEALRLQAGSGRAHRA